MAPYVCEALTSGIKALISLESNITRWIGVFLDRVARTNVQATWLISAPSKHPMVTTNNPVSFFNHSLPCPPLPPPPPPQSKEDLFGTRLVPRLTGSGRKDVMRIFEELGLRITIQIYLKVADFLDVTFNLNREVLSLPKSKWPSILYPLPIQPHPRPVLISNLPTSIVIMVQKKVQKWSKNSNQGRGSCNEF